jgi:hypothetical protein
VPKMLNQFLADESEDSKEVKPSIIKVRGKTLIFGNVVYQIHNISSIGLVDLTTTKPIPKYFWGLLVAGILLFLTPMIQPRILGVICLAVVAWLFYNHFLSKTKERYGLTIYTSAGTKTIFVSRSEDFIKKVILSLYSVMNDSEPKAINFNFENLSIDRSETSVQIGTNIASPINTGYVEGDVVAVV